MAFINPNFLGYCPYTADVVHRDVKLGNIMLTSEAVVKLIDFGLCTSVERAALGKVCGSPQYMAPEIINNLPHGQPADLWALGIVLARAANRDKQKDRDEAETLRYMFNVGLSGLETVPLRKPTDWSEAFKEVLSSCLQFDPARRPSAIAVLASPWLGAGSRLLTPEQFQKTLRPTLRHLPMHHLLH